MPSLLILSRKRLRRIIFVIAATFLLWGYCSAYVDPTIGCSGIIGMSFQILAFSIGWLILIRKDPSGRLTLGNLGFLYALVCISYLLFPSILWFTNSNIHIQYDAYITPEIGGLLLWLHGLYFLMFTVVFVVSSRPMHNLKMFARNEVPASYWFPIVAFLALILVVLLQQLWLTGQLVPQREREISVLSAYEAGVKSVQSGGFSLLIHQILNRMVDFVFLFFGVGFGLVLAKNAFKKAQSLLLLIFISLMAGSMVILTGGGRGPGFIAVLIGLVFADYLSGPLRWRYLLVLFVMGLIGSEFFAYARFLSGNQFFELPNWISYWIHTENKFIEQTAMFGKEAVIVSEVAYTGEAWGLIYFVQTLLRVIPQQLFPFKIQFSSVAAWLGELLLGIDVERGSGLAGTAIGEGYLILGVLGVGIIGGVTGLILGLAQRLLLERSKARVWHLIPLVYIAGNLLFVLRSDLYALLNTLVLGAIPLWVGLHLLFGRLRPASLWNQRLFHPHPRGDDNVPPCPANK